MRETSDESLIAQLKKILDLYLDLSSRFSVSDLHKAPDTEIHTLVTLARAAVLRIAGPTSEYAQQLERIMHNKHAAAHHTVGPIMGVIEALRLDLEAGYLRSLSELLHGEIFADLLDMATHLLEEGYKDAAAVVTGTAIEAHLRRLAEASGLGTEIGGKPKKADLLNAELTKGGVYSRLDQKNITAWLDLRNRAAHGKFDEYSKEQVAILLAGARNFIARNPA
jgi:hypothetical protein